MKSIGSFLRLSRIVVGVAVLSLITFLFADFGMQIPAVASWLVKVQLLPAAMSFAVTILVAWFIVTLLFGRIYCSTVCPLGVFQDLCARLPRLRRRVKPKWHYHYSAPKSALRTAVLFVVVLSVFLGLSALTTLLDPYSIFGRFGVYVVKPLWAEVLNLWSAVDSALPIRFGVASLLGAVIAGLTMLVIGVLAFRNGRTFCNMICPVGTTLSIVSRYSVFRIDINTDKCIQCRRCEHRCKSSCIDLTSHVVDTSRCVVCFDCLTECPNDAISYTHNRHRLSIPLMQRVKEPVAGPAAGMVDSRGVDVVSSTKVVEDKITDSNAADDKCQLLDRRRFLTVGAIVASTPLIANAAKTVAKVNDAASSRQHRNLLAVTPPGVKSRREFLDRCTSCGLCIDRCPQKVLRASTDEYGLLRALHPVANYDESWCVYDCTLCANLCPAGALHPLTIKEKHSSRSGIAYTDRLSCISYNLTDKCGACARRCPAETITMVTPAAGKGAHPVVDIEKCIGCGACQYVCPAEPKAIRVGGLA